jgi:hypothetical protein
MFGREHMVAAAWNKHGPPVKYYACVGGVAERVCEPARRKQGC